MIAFLQNGTALVVCFVVFGIDVYLSACFMNQVSKRN